MKTINATEFKARCLQLLDEVAKTGEDLVISKRGKPVARVIAADTSKPWLALRGTGRFTGDPFEPAVQEHDVQALK